MYHAASIGCNTVAGIDESDYYTEAVYYDLLKEYRDEGFSHVEFSHVFQLNAESSARLCERAMELGITIWSLHSWHLNDWTPEALEVYRGQQEHCAMVAGALGCSVMVCHLPNIENRTFEQSLEIMTMVADQCRKYGVRLAIETCFKGDVEEIIRVVDTLNRPDVGINVDTGHCNSYIGRTPADVIRQCGKRIITLHLQDNYGLNDDHQMPGMGTIDWYETLSALKEVGYKGPLMMEMTGPGVKIRRTVEMLRDYDIEKERIQGAAYLVFINSRISNRGTVK